MNTLSETPAFSEAELSRGQTEFDAQALRKAVDAAGAKVTLSAQTLAEYTRFYGFNMLLAEVTHQASVLEVDADRVVVHTFTPGESPTETEPTDPARDPAGYVLLCHGYYDHAGLYGHVIRYFTQHNLAVITFDQVGHGLSTGPRANVESFQRYVEVTHAVYSYAREQLNIPADTAFHWAGQSMGGAIVMETLHQHAEIKAGHVVLFAPLIRPYAWWFARWVYAVARRTVESRPRRITTNASNVEFIRLQHADPLQPDILPVQWVTAMVAWFEQFKSYGESKLAPRIIQGEQDKTIDWRHGTKVITRRYPDSRWCRLPDASHHLVNESQTLRQQMFNWLDENCDWSTQQQL